LTEGRARTVNDNELEDVIAMTRNLFDAEVLDLTRSVLSKHLVCPKVPNLHKLVRFYGDTKVSRTELEVVIGMFTPVDNQSDSIPTRDCSCINLRSAPEPIIVRAAQEASCLFRFRILVHSNKLFVHKNIERGLWSN